LIGVSRLLPPEAETAELPKRLPSYSANLCRLLFGASLRSSPEGKIATSQGQDHRNVQKPTDGAIAGG
jgi:hypothetical protein